MPDGRSKEGQRDTDGSLEMRWWSDGDGTGKLTVRAESASGFAGRSWAWFDQGQVVRFAKRLGEYPLPTLDSPQLVGGSEPIGGPFQVLVGLRAYPVGSRGQVGITVTLATEPWQSPAMRQEEHQSVTLEVLTTYERLRRFSGDLQGLLVGAIPAARIDGEHMVPP